MIDNPSVTLEGFSAATASLIERYKTLVVELDSQIADLKAGNIRFLRGAVDCTDEAIALAVRQREGLLQVINSVAA
jgi:hypothetical protein